jgi:hypothetical protein
MKSWTMKSIQLLSFLQIPKHSGLKKTLIMSNNIIILTSTPTLRNKSLSSINKKTMKILTNGYKINKIIMSTVNKINSLLLLLHPLLLHHHQTLNKKKSTNHKQTISSKSLTMMMMTTTTTPPIFIFKLKLSKRNKNKANQNKIFILFFYLLLQIMITNPVPLSAIISKTISLMMVPPLSFNKKKRK